MEILINEKTPNDLPDNTFVGVDLEMWEMNQKQMHRPISGEFACLTVSFPDDRVFLYTEEKYIPYVLKRIDNYVWCIHNSSFDIVQLRRYAKVPPRIRLWDSLLIERIMWNGYFDRFSLKDLVRRYLAIHLDKDLRKTFKKRMPELSEEQIEYAAQDANYHRMVALAQKEKITRTHFKLWKEIDMPTQWAIFDFQGFRIDGEKWLGLADYHLSQRDKIDEELPFNPRSTGKTGQMACYCKENFDIDLQSIAADYLIKEKRKSKNSEFKILANLVLKSNALTKKASTYGEKFFKDFAEWEDENVSVIIASFDPNKAKTGRMASNSPNMQNIPARETPIFRECFIARPGNKLLIADFSSQEPRIMAYMTQDPKLVKFFKEGGDPYIRMGEEFYGETIDKKDKRRKKMKDLFLAMGYGFTEKGMSERYDMTIKESKEFLGKARQIFPVAMSAMDEIGEEKECAMNLLGRQIWLNPYHYKRENLARNAPIQSTAADMMKKSIVELHKQQCSKYGKFYAVAPVHDELVLDVPEDIVHEVKGEVEETMINVAEEICPGIPFIAEAVIADNWAGKE